MLQFIKPVKSIIPLLLYPRKRRLKIEGGPLVMIKFRKVSQSRNKHKNVFGQVRDSNPRPSVSQASENPD